MPLDFPLLERAAGRACDGDLSLLEPQALELRLRDLIRAYVRARSAELARAVVAHLEALCLHPRQRDPADFCAYRRLAAHWRLLLALHGEPAAQPTAQS
jgi:hypothetical protein